VDALRGWRPRPNEMSQARRSTMAASAVSASSARRPSAGTRRARARTRRAPVPCSRSPGAVHVSASSPSRQRRTFVRTVPPSGAERHLGVVLARVLVARRVGDGEAREVELVRALQPRVFAGDRPPPGSGARAACRRAAGAGCRRRGRSSTASGTPRPRCRSRSHRRGAPRLGSSGSRPRAPPRTSRARRSRAGCGAEYPRTGASSSRSVRAYPSCGSGPSSGVVATAEGGVERVVVHQESLPRSASTNSTVRASCTTRCARGSARSRRRHRSTRRVRGRRSPSRSAPTSDPGMPITAQSATAGWRADAGLDLGGIDVLGRRLDHAGRGDRRTVIEPSASRRPEVVRVVPPVALAGARSPRAGSSTRSSR
jgi:hypothetical protein